MQQLYYMLLVLDSWRSLIRISESFNIYQDKGFLCLGFVKLTLPV